eukprot:jgi/Undpi1/8733/HiC_scaffold_25.g11195.m1
MHLLGVSTAASTVVPRITAHARGSGKSQPLNGKDQYQHYTVLNRQCSGRDAARFAVGATTRDITGAAVGAAVGAAAGAVVVSVLGDAAGAAVWVTFGYAAGIAVGAATRHAAGPPRTNGARWFVRMCSEVNPAGEEAGVNRGHLFDGESSAGVGAGGDDDRLAGRETRRLPASEGSQATGGQGPQAAGGLGGASPLSADEELGAGMVAPQNSDINAEGDAAPAPTHACRPRVKRQKAQPSIPRKGLATGGRRKGALTVTPKCCHGCRTNTPRGGFTHVCRGTEEGEGTPTATCVYWVCENCYARWTDSDASPGSFYCCTHGCPKDHCPCSW